VRLSNDDRRALGVILGLLLLATAARWIERPRPLLLDSPEVDLVALEEASRAARPPPRAGPPSSPIDPNTATASELQRLPGVGPAMALRIIEERERAPFICLEDMLRVRGIGEGVLGKIRDHVGLASGAGAGSCAGAGAGNGGVTVRGGGVGVGAGGPVVDLNRAGVGELVKISGVGPVLAARLVARRDSLGGYRDWSEVDAVTGVGPAMLLKLQSVAILGR
jgi:competence ComEA-like helix-hairpin-helix protein